MKSKKWQPFSPAAAKPEPDMDAYFKTLQETDYADTFNKTAVWVRQNQPRTVGATVISWPHWLRLFLFGSSVRVAYTVLFFITMVGACNYPVEVNEPVASVLTWQVNAQDKATINAISGLPWLKEEQLLAESRNINGNLVLEYTVTLPALKKDQLQAYQQSLQQLIGIQNLKILPITHKTSQPLYEAALENMLKIEMDVTNISDADLKKAVEAKLKQQGLTNLDIAIKKDDNGQRLVTTKLPEVPVGNQNFDLLLKDGKRHTRIREQKKFNPGSNTPDFKNMTDAQIKEVIIRDHPALPLTPDDIKITRQGQDILIAIDDQKGNHLKLRLR
ncbi:hypothetical protein HUW51_19160 [Adhaeribacter swui]|uniref:Uncharacterized protein n=1 Tax=Adhaeribacter swui TaxID=2086471 RepID=A0A7G7GC61_9BACT|nr:hypothetical protein [Adhaeribacter swui]QNF34745.1 hypothetical protein HUW51_19160 [Adhaeribacter swui]